MKIVFLASFSRGLLAKLGGIFGHGFDSMVLFVFYKVLCYAFVHYYYHLSRYMGSNTYNATLLDSFRYTE